MLELIRSKNSKKAVHILTHTRQTVKNQNKQMEKSGRIPQRRNICTGWKSYYFEQVDFLIFRFLI